MLSDTVEVTPPAQEVPVQESPAPEVQTPQQPAVVSLELTLRYIDADFETKLRRAVEVRTLAIDGLPHGVRLRHAVGETGFYFWFDDGSQNIKRYYYPKGLREIRVNSQYINVDLERKWLIESYLAKYCPNSGGFFSINNVTDLRAYISYISRLSHIAEDKLDFLFKSLCLAVEESSSPYFRIYVADIVLARILKCIMLHKLKQRLASLDDAEIISMTRAIVSLLDSAQAEAQRALSEINCPAQTEQFMPLSGDTLKTNPRAFWLGSLYQAQRRSAFLKEVVPAIEGGTLLDLLSDSDVLEALSGGRAAAVFSAAPGLKAGPTMDAQYLIRLSMCE